MVSDFWCLFILSLESKATDDLDCGRDVRCLCVQFAFGCFLVLERGESELLLQRRRLEEMCSRGALSRAARVTGAVADVTKRRQRALGHRRLFGCLGVLVAVARVCKLRACCYACESADRRGRK